MTNSIPPAGRTTLTRDQIIAENLIISTRNQARQTRRDLGETNVENDEALLVVPPSFTNTIANTVASSSSSTNVPSSSANSSVPPSLHVPTVPVPTTPRPTTPNSNVTSINMSNMLAAFQQLSPSKQLNFQASMNASLTPPSVPSSSTTHNTSAVPSLIFDVAKERPPPSSNSVRDVYGIHSYILELAKNNQHIPFSLLTSKITRRLFLESSTLKFITFYSSHRGSVPTKCHLLDISQFPAEADISIPEWHEAWARYIRFLQEYASPEIHSRWADHYDILRKHPDFTDNWAAILTFDIEQRASYAADPQALDEVKYYRQLESIKGRVARKESLKVVSDAVTNLKGHRHEPYPPRDSSFRKTQNTDKSFRAPTKSNDSERLPPLCLICGQLGHTFPNCPDSSSSSSSSHAKAVEKQLVSRSNADVKYCVDFNIFCNGKRTCIKRSHKTGEIHACSLCGSSEHGACSRKCLGT
ncbi:hypothetical protein P692DRAFT_201896301 [Suillus brevipes Sb2]|nr:hypothetical protein P692DRAFT_201896301 [Suillus brevipes Sb2]